MATAVQSKRKAVPWGRIALVGVISAVLAAVANYIVYLIANNAGAFNGFDVQGQAFNWIPVVAVSLMGVLMGTVVFALLARFTGRPKFWFLIVAIVVLVLYFFPPLFTPGVPRSAILWLEIMHIVAGSIAITGLNTFALRD